MLVLISPAKSLETEADVPFQEYTQPALLKQASYLAGKSKKLSAKQLEKLMKISPQLGQLNHERFQIWQEEHTIENARPAIFTFDGEVYRGLDPFSFSGKNLAFAQSHLRILSGLYGLLAPTDLMQPYRLEMGTSLKITQKKTNLYQYWEDTIAKEVKSLAKDGIVVNLASNEYFKSVGKHLKDLKVVDVVFEEFHNGKYKVISFLAKKARGLMARYIIENELTEIEQLKGFDTLGYQFVARESDATTLKFKRG